MLQLLCLLDDEVAYHKIIQPAGINKDGRAKLYHRFTIKAGNHKITARLKDHKDLQDYNYQETRQIHLASRAVLVVDFDPDEKKFIIIGATDVMTEE